MLLPRINKPFHDKAPASTPTLVPTLTPAETRITFYCSKCRIGMMLGVLALLGKSSYRAVFDALKQLDALGCYNILRNLQCVGNPRRSVKNVPWTGSKTDTDPFDSTSFSLGLPARASTANVSKCGVLLIDDTPTLLINLHETDTSPTPMQLPTRAKLSAVAETWASRASADTTSPNDAYIIFEQQRTLNNEFVGDSWGHFVFLEDE
jgi:hypothetical protein